MGKTVECPECGEIHRNVPPKYFGKKIRCPSCEAVIQVPGGKSKRKSAADRAERNGGGPSDDGGNRRHRLQRAGSKNRPAKRREKSRPAEDEPVAEESPPEEQTPPKKKKKKRKKLWTLKRVYIALCAIIGVIGWFEMAKRYTIDVEGRVPGAVGSFNAVDHPGPTPRVYEISSQQAAIDYFYNAATKLPKFPQVIWHCLTKAWGIPLMLFVLIGGLGGIFFGLSFLDQQLAEEQREAPRSITLDNPFVHPDDARGEPRKPRRRRRSS